MRCNAIPLAEALSRSHPWRSIRGRRRKKSVQWQALSASFVLFIACGLHPAHADAKHTVLGTALTPAHFPAQTDKEVRDAFDEAAQIGSHIAVTVQWDQPLNYRALKLAAIRPDILGLGT